jgi:hypothetical protein
MICVAHSRSGPVESPALVGRIGMFEEFRWASFPAAVMAVILGLLWLIQGLAGDGDGPLSGGWWKGPLLSLAGLSLLAWRWRRP